MTRFSQFIKRLLKAKNIVITTHIHPDADGIGSQVALGMALRRKGLKAICVNELPLMERYRYLDPEGLVCSVEQYLTDHEGRPDVDLFLVVDTNSILRIGENIQQLVKASNSIYFLDHHPYYDELTEFHIIDTEMAATGELVGKVIEELKIPFTKDIALPIYTSILIDTSSFRYPTVSSNTHRLVAKLLETGLRPEEAYNHIYGTKKISHMKYLGEVLLNAQNNEEGTLAWLTLGQKTLDQYQVDLEDTLSFINYLLVLDNIKVACMFTEHGPQHVKLSLRSNGDVDVGQLARLLGGGGHGHSAATILEGGLEKVIPKAVEKMTLFLKESLGD